MLNEEQLSEVQKGTSKEVTAKTYHQKIVSNSTEYRKKLKEVMLTQDDETRHLQIGDQWGPSSAIIKRKGKYGIFVLSVDWGYSDFSYWSISNPFIYDDVRIACEGSSGTEVMGCIAVKKCGEWGVIDVTQDYELQEVVPIECESFDNAANRLYLTIGRDLYVAWDTFEKYDNKKGPHVSDKYRAITLLKETNREGIDKLIDFLDKNTEFFRAPSSRTRHHNWNGGLLDHSLGVYYIAKEMAVTIAHKFTDDQLVIAALLHDVCKATKYVLDNHGKYIINSKDPAKDVLGHGNKSVYIVEELAGFKLTPGERLAIRWHMGQKEKDWLRKSPNFDSLEQEFDTLYHMNLPRIIKAADGLNASRHKQRKE